MSRLLVTLILLTPLSIFAWSEHALSTYLAFAGVPEMQGNVQTESLESFLTKEEKGLEKLLADEEIWLRQNLDFYMPRPDSLAFKGEGRKDIQKRFFQAIRVNPESKAILFVRAFPGKGRICPPIPYSSITLYDNNLSMVPGIYCTLGVGESLPAIDVVSTAADEPDYGMDIGLFDDSKTTFGDIYAFGKQPFGNPELAFSSQAPFHMGFYHESFIVYLAAGFISRTNAEFRARLYASLSQYAFKTGHPYWGYRFMGWGMHYIGDLTQPYHATVLPGVNVFSMLWTNIKDQMGFPADKETAIRLVSNRHLSLEDFQRTLIRQSFNDKESALYKSLADVKRDNGYPKYSANYIRDVLTKESNGRADETDELLERLMPSQLVNDAGFNFDPNQDETDPYEMMKDKKETMNEMNGLISDLFGPFGSHSRIYAKGILSP